MATMCEECRNIGCRDRSLNELDWFAHHDTVISFLAAVRQGCYVCKIILREMKHADVGLVSTCVNEDARPFLKYYLNIEADKSDVRKIKGLYFFPGSEDPGQFVRRPPFPVCVVLREATEDDMSQCSLEIGLSTDSEHAYSLAALWLSECQANHSLCKLDHGQEAWWPSRLVDVGSEVDNRNLSLVMREELPLTGRYLTLSHSWGNGVVYRCTSSNINALRHDIPIQNLSKTFQQAISITRTLGERYLWIDALCIVQDSVEDWTKESAMMGQVYLQAHCNISATAAEDGSEGCFFPRSRETSGPAIFYCHAEGFDSSTPHRLWHLRQWDSDVEHARLGTRAWVVQEKLLSPRKLLYTSSQLFWQCRQLTACESFPKGVVQSSTDFNTLYTRLAQRLKSPSLQSTNMPNPQEIEGYNDLLWFLLIRIYSATELTYQSDKLMAIGGLASLFQNSQGHGDEYIWGHWRRDFILQLFWEVAHGSCGNGKPSYRPLPHRAPAWSWTSVEGNISTTGANYGTMMSDHVRLIVPPKATQPTGPDLRDWGAKSNLRSVLSNSVTIEAGTCRARVLKRSLHVPQLNAHDLLLMEHTFDDSVLPRNLADVKFESLSLSLYEDRRGNRAYVDSYSFKPDEAIIQQYKDEYLCLVGAARCSHVDGLSTEGVGEGDKRCWLGRHEIRKALILSRVETQDSNEKNIIVYRRIGLYMLEVSTEHHENGLALEKMVVTMI